MTIIQIIFCYFILINLISFSIFGIDKNKAKNNRYRIPEATLLTTVLIGGFIGASIGMILFKHKLSKPKFIITIIISTILYLVLTGLVLFNQVPFLK